MKHGVLFLPLLYPCAGVRGARRYHSVVGDGIIAPVLNVDDFTCHINASAESVTKGRSAPEEQCSK